MSVNATCAVGIGAVNAGTAAFDPIGAGTGACGIAELNDKNTTYTRFTEPTLTVFHNRYNTPGKDTNPEDSERILFKVRLSKKHWFSDHRFLIS